jgi:hypothetical protein
LFLIPLKIVLVVVLDLVLEEKLRTTARLPLLS